jgi:YARHG domain
MNRYSLIIFILIYLLSCTSNDRNWSSKDRLPTALAINNGSIKKGHLEEIKEFSYFLKEMAKEQMIASGDVDLQRIATLYFPDSTVIEGFDLHAREIGNLDTFRLVYYEYFDLYSPENEAYLGIFSPAGEALDVHRLRQVSFEGNVNINLIDQQLVEISYYDFFEKERFGKNGLIPIEGFYINEFDKKRNILEGYIYEYYRIGSNGQLKSFTENTIVSIERKYPQSSARVLSFSEIEILSYDAILRMKNEILAEHGYIFSNNVIQKQFEKEDWYTPRHTEIEPFLTKIEKINLTKLQKLERQY